jgi:hypothetical protein
VILIQDTTKARWPIEVASEDGKELYGLGQVPNRTKKAVKRTVAFQFLAMTLTIIWYATPGHHPADVDEHRRRPWYLTKTTHHSPTCSPAPKSHHRRPSSPGQTRPPHQQK